MKMKLKTMQAICYQLKSTYLQSSLGFESCYWYLESLWQCFAAGFDFAGSGWRSIGSAPGQWILAWIVQHSAGLDSSLGSGYFAAAAVTAV